MDDERESGTETEEASLPVSGAPAGGDLSPEPQAGEASVSRSARPPGFRFNSMDQAEIKEKLKERAAKCAKFLLSRYCLVACATALIYLLITVALSRAVSHVRTRASESASGARESLRAARESETFSKVKEARMSPRFWPRRPAVLYLTHNDEIPPTRAPRPGPPRWLTSPPC